MSLDHDDAVVRQVAAGLVRLAGTEAAAAQLDRLYGRARAVQALDRRTRDRAEPRPALPEVTLDLTEPDPVVHIRDAYSDAPSAPPRHVYWL